MLSEELLVINKTVQGDIAGMDTLRWYIKFDAAKQREITLLARMCLERANPTQEGVDKIIDKGYLNVAPFQSEIFKERHYDQAIAKASEVPDDEIGNSFYAFIELLRYFDELQRKTVCKDGCDHEWHNLTWVIRTNDIQKLVDFYSLLGLKLTHYKHGTSFHYAAQSGQSVPENLYIDQTQKDMGLGLHLKFTRGDFDGVIKTLKEKQVSFVTETGTMP